MTNTELREYLTAIIRTQLINAYRAQGLGIYETARLVEDNMNRNRGELSPLIVRVA